MKLHHLIIAFLAILPTLSSVAQDSNDKEMKEMIPTQQRKPKHAWEIGVGGTMLNWDRTSVTGFKSTDNQYQYRLKVRHLMGGVNLYVAHELSRWFYLDFQGTAGFAGK